MNLDECDRQILEAVSNRALWKQKIWETIETDESVREIAQRVENLVEEGYLTSTIIEPAEISPELIIAFKLTDRADDFAEKGGSAGN